MSNKSLYDLIESKGLVSLEHWIQGLCPPSKQIGIIDDILSTQLYNSYLNEFYELRVNLVIDSLRSEFMDFDLLYDPNNWKRAAKVCISLFEIPPAITHLIDSDAFEESINKRIKAEWPRICVRVKREKQNLNWKDNKIVWQGNEPELVELFLLLKDLNKIDVQTEANALKNWKPLYKNFVISKGNPPYVEQLNEKSIARTYYNMENGLINKSYKTKWRFKGSDMYTIIEKSNS